MKKIIIALLICMAIQLSFSQSIVLNLKVYIEGPYYNGQMTPFLNVLGYLPTNQPYNIAPWNYNGTESVISIPSSNIVDWVLVDVLKPHFNGNQIRFELMGRQVGFLSKNGFIKDIDGVSYLTIESKMSTGFYVRVHHRNHLSVISAQPLVESGGVFSYDFTTSADQALGGFLRQKQLSSLIWGMIAADANASGQIDNQDKNEIWLIQQGQTGYFDGDFNMDTQVDADDKVVKWEPNSGKSSYPLKDTILPLFICGTSSIIYNGLEYGTVEFNNKCWLDRNLGAIHVATAYNDPLSFGDLYQWGRLFDGHQLRTSATTNILSSSDVPGHADFIVVDDDPYDWRSPQNNNLWQEVSNINNPCPDGWKIPTLTEWQETSIGWTNRTDAFNSLLKLSSAGWRNESAGNVSNAGSWGNYWTTNVNSTGARGIYFDSFNFNSNTYARASGRSVRCLKSDFVPNNAPNIPIDPIPPNEATNVETTIDLSWVCSDPDGDDLTYNIYFGLVASPPLIQTNFIGNVYNPGPLNINTIYFWKIVAYDIYGDSTQGVIWNFTTIPESGWACGNLLLDTRDDQTYNTVQIGNQCWMAENINIGSILTTPQSQSNNGIIEKYCYNNIPSNCDSYGGLYQWNETMQYLTNEGAQGICTDGWHVPTDSEWFIMENYLDPTINDPALKGWRGSTGGTLLKQGGASGFEALLAGSFWGSGNYFSDLGTRGWFRTSSLEYADMNFYRALDINYSSVYKNGTIHSHGYSARCIKSEYINQPPAPPSDPSPTDGAQNQPLNTILSWTCSDPENDPLTFDVFFGTINPPPIISSAQTEYIFDPGTLILNTTYYWKIIAYDTYSNFIESSVWSFTTIPQPVWTCGGPFVDVRDGQAYNTVQINYQCWMAENLNIGLILTTPQNQSNNGIIEKYCYANIPSNCDSYGGLYQWNETMQYVTNEGTQGICPGGWHVPTDSEWFIMENYLDPTINNPLLKDWRGTNCGTILKQGGLSGFEALLSGSWWGIDGYYSGLGTRGWFRTSSLESSNFSFYRAVDISYPTVYRNASTHDRGYSVRCLKDQYTNQPPAVPSEPSPTDGAQNQPLNTILSWACSDPENDPLTFDVFFGTINPPPIISSFQTEYTFNPGTLTLNTTYYWKIIAYDTYSNFTESSVWSFTTIQQPVWSCGETFVDVRDGQAYNTVQINNQCWMSENLNIGNVVLTPNQQSNNGIIEKYCYDNIVSKCNTYGGLYQWDETMQYVTTPGTIGICPVGWHIPTDNEWFVLENYVDPSINNPSEKGWRGIDCGTKFKQGGSTGFEAMMAGSYWGNNDYYSGIKDQAWFRTSSLESSDFTFYRSLYISYSSIYRNASIRSHGYSVRCLKD